MNEATIVRVRALVIAGAWRLSAHAVQELVADNLLIEPLVDGIMTAVVVED